MSSDRARQDTNAAIGDALFAALALTCPRRLTPLEHGWRIFRGAEQIAAGYTSDNAPGHAVEFALNQHLLAERLSERAALVRWLERQKQRFGGREPHIHQRGIPVDWFRIGFDSADAAFTFLDELSRQRNNGEVATRWAPEGYPAGAAHHLAGADVIPDGMPEPAQRAELPVNDGMAGPDVETDEQIGNLRNEDYALACIPLLVDHVLGQTDDVMQQLTYEELARRLGRVNKHGAPAARGLGVVLGRAMEHIDRATAAGATPYLTTVVVAKSGPDEGLPGIGVRERWHGYDLLTRAEKAARVEAEYQRILRFGNQWNDVLAALGMSPCRVPDVPAAAQARGGGWGGGESDQHKALKQYVMTHPELFGAVGDGNWRATAEYALRSGDEIDVFFKSDRRWIGVEVKSSLSDGNLKDYERGLYQAVKYHAVLSAQARIDRPATPPAVKVVLALESRLPHALRAVAKALQVHVVDGLSSDAREGGVAA